MRGFFLDDVIWGPAEYHFAALPGYSNSGSQGTSPETDGQPQQRRLRYAGMMNGRPQGKGCMSWSDGTQQMGQVCPWWAGCNAWAACSAAPYSTAKCSVVTLRNACSSVLPSLTAPTATCG